MATQTLPQDPTATRIIRIPGTDFPAPTQAVAAVGELVRFSVRQNQDGQGQLYYRGYLIPATLPPNLQAGDRVTAKVTDNVGQLVLKIVETNQSGSAAAISPEGLILSGISNNLEKLLKSLGGPGLKGPAPLILDKSLAEILGGLDQASLAVNDLTAKLTQLFSTISVSDSSGKTQNQLQASVSGSLLDYLKESAQLIRGFLAAANSETLDRVHAQLTNLLSALKGETHLDESSLGRLLSTLSEDLNELLKNSKALTQREREVIQSVLKELTANNSTGENLAAKVETLLRTLTNGALLTKQKGSPLDSNLTVALSQVAEQLDRLARTQESLNTLNPLMQALGEPVLILFPFLAQGLLTHSEVTVQSRNEGRKRKRKNKDGEGERTEAPDTSPYQRIQVTVPLPYMGDVDVDIAHRKDEIFVRFTVSDQEVGAFLLEQLENLSGILRAQNFKKAELVAHVGIVQDHSPAWAEGLRASTSVLA